MRQVAEGKLVAIVSDVPAAAFDQPALDENVRDGRWLTPRATAHQAVNAAAHAMLAASLPVAFGTIYRSDEGIREMLRARSAELHAKLVALHGRSEWVVALQRDTVQAAEHLAQMRDAMTHAKPDTAPGRNYLEKRRDEGELRAELRRLDDEAALAARHSLGRVSKSAYDEPVVEDAGDVVARTTYVLRGEDEHRFADAVEGFNADWKARGYELSASGPWPTYRSSGSQ